MSISKSLLILLVALVSCGHVISVGGRAFGAVLTGSPDGRPGSYGLSNTYSSNLGPFHGPYQGYNRLNHPGNNVFGTGYLAGGGGVAFSGLGHGAYDFQGNYGAPEAAYVAGFGPRRQFAAGVYGLPSGIDAFGTLGTGYDSANGIGY